MGTVLSEWGQADKVQLATTQTRSPLNQVNRRPILPILTCCSRYDAIG